MGLPFICRLAANELPAVRLAAAGGWGSNRASFWLLTRSVVGLRSGWLGSGLGGGWLGGRCSFQL